MGEKLLAFITGEGQESVVDHLNTGLEATKPVDGAADLLNRQMWVPHSAGVEQIRRKGPTTPLVGLAVHIRVAEQPLDGTRVLAPVKPHDHDMDVGLPAGVRPPGKGPMREGEVKAIPVEENWPQEADLLTLRHGVGRNKADADRLASLADVRSCLDEPSGHVVKSAPLLAELGDSAHLGGLLLALLALAPKRRIAEDVVAVPGWQRSKNVSSPSFRWNLNRSARRRPSLRA